MLGYEVLGYDWGWHSYLCNGLEVGLVQVFGGELNAGGLIKGGGIAERLRKMLIRISVGGRGDTCRMRSTACREQQRSLV